MLEIAPDLAVGDGVLGFWKAIEEVFQGTRHQRCWVHKTANVLNKVALSVQINMKADLRRFAARRPVRRPRPRSTCSPTNTAPSTAVACLTKDREALLAFFDFQPSTGTIYVHQTRSRACSRRCGIEPCGTKGALSAKTAKLMVFKLVNAAAKTWRRLKGENQLPKVVQGAKFQNGIEVIKMPAHHAA